MTTGELSLLRCGACGGLTFEVHDWSAMTGRCTACGESCGACRGSGWVWVAGPETGDAVPEVCPHLLVRS